MTNNVNTTGRITAKQYYEELLAQRTRMEDMERKQRERDEIQERRIMASLEMMRTEVSCLAKSSDYERLIAKLDILSGKFEQYALKTDLDKIAEHTRQLALKADLDKISERVDKLTLRDSIWNGLNSLGVLIASAIAAAFGSKQ